MKLLTNIEQLKVAWPSLPQIYIYIYKLIYVIIMGRKNISECSFLPLCTCQVWKSRSIQFLKTHRVRQTDTFQTIYWTLSKGEGQLYHIHVHVLPDKHSYMYVHVLSDIYMYMYYQIHTICMYNCTCTVRYIHVNV